MSIHAGQSRSLSLHQTQPSVSAARKPPSNASSALEGRAAAKTRSGLEAVVSVPVLPPPGCASASRCVVKCGYHIHNLNNGVTLLLMVWFKVFASAN